MKDDLKNQYWNCAVKKDVYCPICKRDLDITLENKRHIIECKICNLKMGPYLIKEELIYEWSKLYKDDKK